MSAADIETILGLSLVVTGVVAFVIGLAVLTLRGDQ